MFFCFLALLVSLAAAICGHLHNAEAAIITGYSLAGFWLFAMICYTYQYKPFRKTKEYQVVPQNQSQVTLAAPAASAHDRESTSSISCNPQPGNHETPDDSPDGAFRAVTYDDIKMKRHTQQCNDPKRLYADVSAD